MFTPGNKPSPSSLFLPFLSHPGRTPAVQAEVGKLHQYITQRPYRQRRLPCYLTYWLVLMHYKVNGRRLGNNCTRYETLSTLCLSPLLYISLFPLPRKDSFSSEMQVKVIIQHQYYPASIQTSKGIMLFNLALT